MNKLVFPAILVATVMVAGIFAFAPIEQASTVHTTITLGTSTGETAANTNIESTQTQIASLIETSSPAAMVAGADVAVMTATNAGTLYVTVETTANGGTGTVVQIDNADVCADVAIVVADSPYQCSVAIGAGGVVTFEDEDAGGDTAGTIVAVVVGAAANP